MNIYKDPRNQPRNWFGIFTMPCRCWIRPLYWLPEDMTRLRLMPWLW